MLVPPSPNCHRYEVGFPVLWLENDTARGALPEVGEAVKLATGAEAATGGPATVIVVVAVLKPLAFSAVNFTR